MSERGAEGGGRGGLCVREGGRRKQRHQQRHKTHALEVVGERDRGRPRAREHVHLPRPVARGGGAEGGGLGVGVGRRAAQALQQFRQDALRGREGRGGVAGERGAAGPGAGSGVWRRSLRGGRRAADGGPSPQPRVGRARGLAAAPAAAAGASAARRGRRRAAAAAGRARTGGGRDEDAGQRSRLAASGEHADGPPSRSTTSGRERCDAERLCSDGGSISRGRRVAGARRPLLATGAPPPHARSTTTAMAVAGGLRGAPRGTAGTAAAAARLRVSSRQRRRDSWRQLNFRTRDFHCRVPSCAPHACCSDTRGSQRLVRRIRRPRPRAEKARQPISNHTPDPIAPRRRLGRNGWTTHRATHAAPSGRGRPRRARRRPGRRPGAVGGSSSHPLVLR